MNRGFLTIAYGEASYLRMARALARSVRFHSPSARLAVVTDRRESELRPLFDVVIPLNEHFGSGVAQKLHVDRYTPYDQTLFIDADCLAFANPEALWGMFRESNGFGVKGWAYLGAADSHYAVKDMASLLTMCGIERIGAFNSGLFYFDRSPAAQRVFETARALSHKAVEIGLKTFKNSPCADEPVFALALELNSLPMLPWDDGKAMCTATADDLQGLATINVFTGQRRLIRYQTVTEPILLHFHFQSQDSFPYLREQWRLRLGERVGRSWVPVAFAMSSYARARASYLMRRVKQRVRQRGAIGLMPERLEMALERRFRSAAP